MGTTYYKLASIIRDTYYKGHASDDSNFSVRFFAEQIAMEVAEMATIDAFTNGNQGETAYSNDQFISTFTNVAVVLDEAQHRKYVVLPATPTSLPNNQEITYVAPVFAFGNSKRQFVPMKNKNEFIQDLLPCTPFEIYEVENGRIYFYNIKQYNFTAVNIKMVGAVSSTGSLVDAVLNIPKNYESKIVDKILARLMPLKGVPQDNLNDAISNPA